MNDFFEKELANRDKFNNSLLGLLEKHRVNIPEEVLKASPVPIVNTAAFFLEITEDFSRPPLDSWLPSADSFTGRDFGRFQTRKNSGCKRFS